MPASLMIIITTTIRKLHLRKAELNSKNLTKRQHCYHLVELLVFNLIDLKKVSLGTRRIVQTSFQHFWIRNIWTVPGKRKKNQKEKPALNASRS